MCTKQRWIVNKYTGSSVLIKCGHCPACLQEKANKMTERIRSHYNDAQQSFFVTLTYDRNSAPYIKFEDIFTGTKNLSGSWNLRDIDSIPVYRDTKRCYVRSKDGSVLKHEFCPETVIGHLPLSPGDLKDSHFKGMRSLRWTRDHFGVIWYTDVQLFVKRLDRNLKRDHGKEFHIDWYATTEYGPTTLRPHIHLILFFPKGYGNSVRSHVVKAWPYADQRRTSRYIEWELSASSYVSSYVNCSSYVPAFLRRFFPPKHTNSLFFGSLGDQFQLFTVLQMFERRNFAFTVQDKYHGDSSVVRLLPAHVINRFFPKFKGFSRLSTCEIFNVMRDPSCLVRYAERLDYIRSRSYADLSVGNRHIRVFDFCPDKFDEVRHFQQVIEHHYERCSSLMSRDLWSKVASEIWTRYASFKLRYSLENVNVPWNEYYQNQLDSLVHPDIWSFMSDLEKVPPNLIRPDVLATAKLEKYYFQRIKQKKITNKIMADNGHLV